MPDLPRRCGAQAEKHVLEATLGQVLAGQQGAASLPAHAQGEQPPGQEVRWPPGPVPPARALSLCVQRLTARQDLAAPAALLAGQVWRRVFPGPDPRCKGLAVENGAIVSSPAMRPSWGVAPGGPCAHG